MASEEEFDKCIEMVKAGFLGFKKVHESATDLSQKVKSYEEKLKSSEEQNCKLQQEYEEVTQKLTVAIDENNSMKEKIAHMQLDINRQNELIKFLSTSKDSGESSGSTGAGADHARSEVDWQRVPGGFDISVFIPGLHVAKIGSTGHISRLKHHKLLSRKGAKKLCKRNISSAVSSENIASFSSSENKINEPGCSYSTATNDEDIKSQSKSNDEDIKSQSKSNDEDIDPQSTSNDEDINPQDIAENPLDLEEEIHNDKEEVLELLCFLRSTYSEHSVIKYNEKRRYNCILRSYMTRLAESADVECAVESIINFLLSRQSRISLKASRLGTFGMVENCIVECFFTCKKAGFIALYDIFIQKFFEVFKRGEDFTLYGGGSACVTFVTLCKKLSDFDNIKKLLCPLVKLQKDIIPFLFACVFAACPELKKLLAKNSPSNWTARVIVYIANKKPLKISDEIWDETTQFFKQLRHFAYKSKTPEKLLGDIISDIKRNSCEVEFSSEMSWDYITAILLLSMYHGKEWTQEQLLHHRVYPLKRSSDGIRGIRNLHGAKILLDKLQGALNENMAIKLETV